MKNYKVLRAGTLGNAGDIVSLEPTSQTQERLKKGIICEIKVTKPAETKTRKRTKKAT